MYTGIINYQGNPITVEQAVALNLITVDGDGNVWLFADNNHLIKINGDLQLN